MVYVVCVERWGGTTYYSELVTAFADEEMANAMALKLQGNLPKHDTRYYVDEVEYHG